MEDSIKLNSITKEIWNGRKITISKTVFDTGKYCPFISIRLTNENGNYLGSIQVDKKKLVELMSK